MNPQRAKKLYFIGFVLLTSIAIAWLLIYALNENVNLFYTPSQIAENHPPLKKRLRVGGWVEKGSVQRKDGVKLSFVIHDEQKTLNIDYEGILPDLFREEQAVVALGRFVAQNRFVADQILAEHDENYVPPEMTQINNPSNKSINLTEQGKPQP